MGKLIALYLEREKNTFCSTYENIRTRQISWKSNLKAGFTFHTDHKFQRRLLCDGCLHWLLKGKTDLLFVWRERRILFVAFTKSQNRSWKSNLKAAFTFQKRVFRDSWLCWLLKGKLDPVDSTVCDEMMKLCTGSVKHSNGWYLVVLSQYKVALVNSWWYLVC